MYDLLNRNPPSSNSQFAGNYKTYLSSCQANGQGKCGSPKQSVLKGVKARLLPPGITIELKNKQCKIWFIPRCIKNLHARAYEVSEVAIRTI